MEIDLSKPILDMNDRLAADRLGIAPSQCFVLEDSDNGVAGAARAGKARADAIKAGSRRSLKHFMVALLSVVEIPVR